MEQLSETDGVHFRRCCFLDSISESIVLRSACRNLRFIRCMRGFYGPISKRQFLAAFAFLVLRSDLLLIPQRLLVIHLK